MTIPLRYFLELHFFRRLRKGVSVFASNFIQNIPIHGTKSFDFTISSITIVFEAIAQTNGTTHEHTQHRNTPN